MKIPIQYETLEGKSIWEVDINCIVDTITDYVIAEKEEQVHAYLKVEYPHNYPTHCTIKLIVNCWALDTIVIIKDYVYIPDYSI